MPGKVYSEGSYTAEPRVDVQKHHGDWRDQLVQDGYVVLKGVVPADRAQSYLDSIFNWLETFPHGFRKDDPSSWGPDHLPLHIQ
jgi:hypothetical protein